MPSVHTGALLPESLGRGGAEGDGKYMKEKKNRWGGTFRGRRVEFSKPIPSRGGREG